MSLRPCLIFRFLYSRFVIFRFFSPARFAPLLMKLAAEARNSFSRFVKFSFPLFVHRSLLVGHHTFGFCHFLRRWFIFFHGHIFSFLKINLLIFYRKWTRLSMNLFELVIKNFLFPERNRQLIFSPKIQYNLIAERGEANRNRLQIPYWCPLFENARTFFERN